LGVETIQDYGVLVTRHIPPRPEGRAKRGVSKDAPGGAGPRRNRRIRSDGIDPLLSFKIGLLTCRKREKAVLG
jgi:hypothetical protein